MKSIFDEMRMKFSGDVSEAVRTVEALVALYGRQRGEEAFKGPKWQLLNGDRRFEVQKGGREASRVHVYLPLKSLIIAQA